MTWLLSVREVAQRLQVNPETVRRLARCGVIPAVRICSRLRFRPEDVEAALAKATRTAPARRARLQPA
jgi:excisionase family DNA binding protein